MFSSPTPIDGVVPMTFDSHPPPADSVAARPMCEEGADIAARRPTVASVLDHLRKPAASRLATETHIAAGGMGSIDVAIDLALERRVAIKTLHPHLRSDPNAVRMFLREARLTGLLDHPHIVPVYDLGERDGELFFTMKLVEGRTLADLIRGLPRGPLDTATLYELLDVFAKVCDALAFAHSRGVLHCDVKPANVMVGDFGQVFLTDWGIARYVGDLGAPSVDIGPASTSSGRPENAVIGTPGYMSPEQARGDRQKLDVRSDVFLLGAILYEILTHRQPYLSVDRHETLALAARGSFPTPRNVAGEAAVPLELERIVLHAMAPAPEDRYASVTALKDDVARFMRGGAEFPRRTFVAGEVVVREGEPGEAAYIIVDGRCDITKDSPTGPLALRRIGPGDVFGEMAILTHGPRTATVVATEPTTVLVVTSAVLEQEMAALKPWMATLLESLAIRFRDADARERAVPTPAPPAERIANQVLMTLETWGVADSKHGHTMPWRDVMSEVEAQLGIRPDALLRALQAYGRDIEVDIEGDRISIVDPTSLRLRLRADLFRRI